MSTSKIKVITTQEVGEGYQNKYIGKVLYVEKDGVRMKFDDNEIVQILRACDAMSNDSLDYYNIEKGRPCTE